MVIGNWSFFRIATHIALFVFIGSCSFFQSSKDKKEEPIARVYDKYLYQADIAGVGRGAARPDDSIQAVRNYVDSWVRHNLMLRYAEDNLPEEEQRLNDRLRDYKESLLIYQYENDLVSQKLDTNVSDNEAEIYYNNQKDIFNLKNAIARVRYIMMRSGTKAPLDSVKKWLKNTNDFNEPKIEGFCKQYAVRYSVSDSVWYNKQELTTLLPLGQFDFDNAQYNKNYIEVADSGYTYLIKFDDYRTKGSDAPIDFVRQEIANIIINQRKITFVSSIHKTIYEDALKNGDFEVYVEVKKGN